MRVANIDMTNSSQQCPNGLKTITKSSKQLRGMKLDGAGCSLQCFKYMELNTLMCVAGSLATRTEIPMLFTRLNTVPMELMVTM